MPGTKRTRSSAKGTPSKRQKSDHFESVESRQLAANFLAILTIIMGTESVAKRLFKIKTIRRNKITKEFEGIVFVSPSDSPTGHFHWKIAGSSKTKDSYREKWQVDQSNGFCQTFALMGLLFDTGKISDPGLKKSAYRENTKRVLEFIRDYCLKEVASLWKKTCKLHRNDIWYDEHDLTSNELKEDINKLLEDETNLLEEWRTDQSTYIFE